MYIFEVRVKKSNINGRGVFAREDIPQGSIVWEYRSDHDLSFTIKEYEKMDVDQRKEMHHSAYLSPWTGVWICPPPDDPACFTNHSPNNNLSVKFDTNISPEPFFIANRDIKIGEEITNNYREFDEITQTMKTNWAN